MPSKIITEDVRKYAAERSISEEEAFEERHGGEVEGVRGEGAEVYAKE